MAGELRPDLNSGLNPTPDYSADSVAKMSALYGMDSSIDDGSYFSSRVVLSWAEVFGPDTEMRKSGFFGVYSEDGSFLPHTALDGQVRRVWLDK